MGERIEFSCEGESYIGYLARAESGSGPGVIVLQEWWGLVGHIESVADRFAQAGFTALAPDLYRGETADEPDEAASLFQALNIADAERVMRCAIRRLLDDPATTGSKVGVIGFCMGGQLSLYAACANPAEIGACVNFYGVHPNVHPDFPRLAAPVLGIFAEHDDYASPERVRAMSDELDRLGKPHEFHTYPATRHAFFNDERPAYDPAAATDAWARTLAFLGVLESHAAAQPE